MNSSGQSVSESSLNCVQCGYNLTGVTIGSACPECGRSIDASIKAGAPPTTSGMAVASLVLGICGLPLLLACGFFGTPVSLLAVVLGHVSRSQISARPGVLRGSGMATAGLITGYVSLGLALIIGLLMVALVAGGSF